MGSQRCRTLTDSLPNLSLGVGVSFLLEVLTNEAVRLSGKSRVKYQTRSQKLILPIAVS